MVPSRRVTQWCTRLAKQNSCHAVHLFAPLVGLEITSTLLEQGAFTDVMLTQDKPLWFNVNGKHSVPAGASAVPGSRFTARAPEILLCLRDVGSL